MRSPSTRSPSRPVLRAAPVAALAVMLAGCAGASAPAAASIAESMAASPSPTGGTSGTEAPGLPANFPVMRGMAPDVPLSSEPGLIGRWTTHANGADVYRFLAGALPAAGYRIDLLGPGDTVAIIRFTPPGGQQLQIDLGQAGDGTFMELRLPRD